MLWLQALSKFKGRARPCLLSSHSMNSLTRLLDRSTVMYVVVVPNPSGTHTQAPSFAYALAVRKVKEALREGRELRLELLPVQHMINAAEPVDYPGRS